MIFKSKPDIAEFLGWHVGDGCLSITKRHYEYTLTGDITEEYPFYKEVIVPSFNEIFKEKLNKPVALKKYESVGVCGIYVFNKNFATNLQRNFNLPSGKKVNIQIPSLIKTNEQKEHFIRGLFDTDGSIYFCKSYVKRKKESIYNQFHFIPKLKIATISEILIEQVYNMLLSLGFYPRIQKPVRQRKNEYVMHSVIMDTRKDVNKWTREIGFRSIKHRSKVLIWKKFGFCPPKTTLYERLKILNGKINPLVCYSDTSNLSLVDLKKSFVSRGTNSNF